MIRAAAGCFSAWFVADQGEQPACCRAAMSPRCCAPRAGEGQPEQEPAPGVPAAQAVMAEGTGWLFSARFTQWRKYFPCWTATGERFTGGTARE